MARRFFLLLLLTTLASAACLAAFNIWVDPFQAYRSPERFPARYYPAWQRYQNPGLARTRSYDRIVTGSSLMENILPSEVDARLGGRTINLAISAMTAHDGAQLLQAALATGKPRHVVMHLDYNAFSGVPDRTGLAEAFPAYLYDASRWNDLPYVLGAGTLARSLETASGLRWSRFNEDPERMWYWAHTREFSAAKAVQGLDPSHLNALYRQPTRTLAGMQASYEANLAPLFAAHPQTRFTLLFAPYSALVWCDFAQRGQLEATLAFRDWLFERVRHLPHVELFDFQAEPAYVMDLSHYTDIYHFSPELSRRLLDDIAAGRHRVTGESLKAHNAWLARMARETDPARLIAEARATPSPAAEKPVR